MTHSTFVRFATSLFLFATLCSTLAPATRAAGLHDLPGGDDIPLAARTANGVRGSGLHSLGFVPGHPHASSTPTTLMQAASVPASIDLEQFAPPVGDQGGVNSCVAWATGYYLRGWYARRDGYFPAGGANNTGSFAPMYTYSQIVHGQNVGTTFADHLNIQQSQGIDSRADYTQGDDNYTSLPTSSEKSNAFPIKIDSYEDVLNTPFTPLQGYIQSKLAGGDPVVLAIPVYPEFDHASQTSYVVTSPKAGETSIGNHAVTVFKYDTTGAWIENQWGTGWGLNGWALLTWDFINRYALEAASIVPLSPLERFYGTTQTHWVTRNANAVTSSYHYEFTLGKLYTKQVLGTVPLYGCLVAGSNDHFVTLDPHCEGRMFLGTDGYLYNVLPALVGQFAPTVQIYRCYRVVSGHGDHWVSTDPHCEGYTTEMSLGYLRS
jgi:hypothetical protein